MRLSAKTKTTVESVRVELNNNDIEGKVVDIALDIAIRPKTGEVVVWMEFGGEGIAGSYQITAQDLYNLAVSKRNAEG